MSIPAIHAACAPRNPHLQRSLCGLAMGLALAIAGCKPAQKPTMTPAQQQSQFDAERLELSQIPVPLKSHYLGVANADSWQNPFVVVGTDSLKVIVVMGDANPSPLGAGGLLRPKGARKDIEQIDPANLAEMLADLPASAWPYGRVVAIEESRQPERDDRAAMRRNMESALKTLTGLGIVVNEWSEPSSAR